MLKIHHLGRGWLCFFLQLVGDLDMCSFPGFPLAFAFVLVILIWRTFLRCFALIASILQAARHNICFWHHFSCVGCYRGKQITQLQKVLSHAHVHTLSMYTTHTHTLTHKLALMHANKQQKGMNNAPSVHKCTLTGKQRLWQVHFFETFPFINHWSLVTLKAHIHTLVLKPQGSSELWWSHCLFMRIEPSPFNTGEVRLARTHQL